MRLQLWSWNFAPEPTAMGPVAATWAKAMQERGHSVEVVTAHPHYPPDAWPQKLSVTRETIDGVRVLRLPLVIGHATTTRRLLEELSYAVSATIASAAVARPDAAVVVSPALLGATATLGALAARRIPRVLWLQDILPDAAITTGLVRNRSLIASAEAVERFAYRRANRIVTISHSFADNLRRKGVPDAKLDVVYNPATRGIAAAARPFETQPEVPTLLYMGNIGHSQGLERFVEAFERSPVPARLVVVGTGERAKDVVAAIRSDRVSYEGVVSDRRLARELDAASVGLVTQRPDVVEFNLPSKLMTLMGAALPVLACVSPTSETARIVDASGGGVVGDSRDPEAAIEELGRLLGSRERLAACSEGALAYARAQFEPGHVSAAFEDAIRRAVGG